MDLAHCSLNSVTVKGAGLTEVADLAAQWGFGGVGLWRDVLDGVDLVDASARLRQSGLRVTSVCRGGMFPQPTARLRREATADNRVAVDQAHALGADCLVLVCGAAHGDLADARRQVRDGIAELEPYARQSGVRLAVEPMHPMMASSRSVITSLSEANDLVEAIGSDIVGIALDSYHVWWDAALPQQITRAGERLFSVQLADWVTPIHGELSSRGMPGEGCIDLTGFVADCRNTGGYAGLVEVEILSDRWWAADPKDAVHAAANGLAAV
ncbi:MULTISPECIES: sugar phosphate isomerase/epimerase family protein [Rhodococcus]|uniref:Sugar phosphate isomerase/epimerase n=1 Tax=Rhodococcus opacus TaxID=37919 RepID=A0AAX3YAT8_RHOOP|nr:MULTISPECIES: sugar phosphate isomerase/epimerase family protein [Rhodococcus]ELB89414.1 xylose isomerase domain-containing protein [Rhodococcus wratislaviensis IFP 2016]NHU43369.1 sugar phosphate isomerase/epimerase [Rhodococcus sp. A14]MCZ4584723.1 sugar phosphate isomerase/epimerase [Rhodococcus opacus]MDI9937765.1 sugar phosphate isomerase/epimerase family protein [Rhodococcus sp. IEGM 1351]MDJ0413534.1 sugar phosphate isomerase/epimerase family protein [Rhodococcus opacus]